MSELAKTQTTFRKDLEDAIHYYCSMEVDAAEYFMSLEPPVLKKAIDYHRNRSDAAWVKITDLLDKMERGVV